VAVGYTIFERDGYSPSFSRCIGLARVGRPLAAGGGFICAPSQTIAPDVPIENVIALYETVHNAGRYH
jgi:hypothetical protein